MSALAELDGLRDAVRAAERAEAEARADQGRAQRRLEAARTNVRLCASDDAERMAQVTAELARVQAEVRETPRPGGGLEYRDLAADDRYASAAAQLEEARAAVETWRWERATAAGEELRNQAREVADRYRPVLDQVHQLEREYAALLARWDLLLEPLGIHASDLPASPLISGRFDAVAPPMPTALQHPDEMTPRARAVHEREQVRQRELARRRRAAEDVAAQHVAAQAGVPRVDPTTGELGVPAS